MTRQKDDQRRYVVTVRRRGREGDLYDVAELAPGMAIYTTFEAADARAIELRVEREHSRVGGPPAARRAASRPEDPAATIGAGPCPSVEVPR